MIFDWRILIHFTRSCVLRFMLVIVILLGDSKKCNKIFMVQSAFKLQSSCVLKRHCNMLHLRSLSSESEINYCASPRIAIS